MFNMEDELVLELDGHGVPWLTWINLVVLFLLFILLYYSIVFGFDFSEQNNSLLSSSSSRSDKLLLTKSTTISRSLHTSKVGEHHIIKGDIGTSTSRRIVREGILPREGCSFKSLARGNRFFDDSHSPCYFLELAKKAFLKCLGLDCNSDDLSLMEQRKDK